MRKSTEIKRSFEKIRQLMSNAPNPYKGMSKQEIINHIRKTREKLWEEKLASRFR